MRKQEYGWHTRKCISSQTHRKLFSVGRVLTRWARAYLERDFFILGLGFSLFLLLLIFSFFFCLLSFLNFFFFFHHFKCFFLTTLELTTKYMYMAVWYAKREENHPVLETSSSFWILTTMTVRNVTFYLLGYSFRLPTYRN